MPRTPARCTEADINRAAKVAKRQGMRVVIKPDGTIVLEPVDEQVRLDDVAGVHL